MLMMLRSLMESRRFLGLVSNMARAHDANSGSFGGLPKSFKHPSAPWGFAGEGPRDKRRSDDAQGGRRRWRHPV